MQVAERFASLTSQKASKQKKKKKKQSIQCVEKNETLTCNLTAGKVRYFWFLQMHVSSSMSASEVDTVL